MFGRRRRDEADQVDESDDDAIDGRRRDDDADEVDADRRVRPDVDGPWDSGDADRPTEAPDGWGVLDLGSLVLTLPVEAEVRMDVDEQTQAVNAVAVQYADSVMQLMPYAGPRSSGIWPDVRGEIAGNITSGGGTVEERTGPMGIELRAVVPPTRGSGCRRASWASTVRGGSCAPWSPAPVLTTTRRWTRCSQVLRQRRRGARRPGAAACRSRCRYACRRTWQRAALDTADDAEAESVRARPGDHRDPLSPSATRAIAGTLVRVAS